MEHSGLTWRKSTRSSNTTSGDCVEVAAAWRKSRRSADQGGTTVEVASVEESRAVAVRDSKDPDGPVLGFTPRAWNAFLDGARNGDFDRVQG